MEGYLHLEGAVQSGLLDNRHLGCAGSRALARGVLLLLLVERVFEFHYSVQHLALGFAACRVHSSTCRHMLALACMAKQS